MTLHKTIEFTKKFLIATGGGIGVIIVFILLLQLGIIIKNILFPAQIQAPTTQYGKLPALEFPKNATNIKYTFVLNTVTGTLPDFQDRINVFPLGNSQPNFLNLSKAKEKAKSLGFINEQGIALPEVRLDTATYSWTENQGSLRRKLIMDIVTFAFTLDSNYLFSPSVLNATNIRDEKDAISKAKAFLDDIALMPTDIDLEKTNNPSKESTYLTKPQLFSISNGILVPTSALSKTQILRVDLYQKDMIYKLNTGIPQVTGGTEKKDITLPILYPHPPYSTMNFLIASNEFDTQVVAANFSHKEIQIETNPNATYPLKTAQEAFEELKNGKAYIATAGTIPTINITKVYLAYYLGETQQSYLMPVVVFEGDNGFFAYVPAVQEQWIE